MGFLTNILLAARNMVFKTGVRLCIVTLISKFSPIFAIPQAVDAPVNLSASNIVWVIDNATSLAGSLASPITSLLLFPGALPSLLSTDSIFTPIATVTDTITITITETLTEPPTTVTVSAPSSTVTDVVTISPLPPPTTFQITWTSPDMMTNLSAFNITKFPFGQQNLHILNGMSVDVGAITLDGMVSAVSLDVDELSPALEDDGNATVMQFFYPANSVDPSTEPPGGADFYATPLDLRDARNVSLEYSVFFPSDFDWVQGGKLPGIYGGHTGCSGGNAAVSCFSTRLMWRAGGAGELYLYAPKDKQTDALCKTPPQSVCDVTYGLSVGRGSFHFAPGAWTRVRQTVALNTPGQQDGGFLLEVNGQPVIDRSDVFYRDVPGHQSGSDSGPDNGDDDGDDGNDDNGGGGGDDSGGSTTESGDDDGGEDQGSDNDDGGLLGGLLGSGGQIIKIAVWPPSGILVLRDYIDDNGDDDTEPVLLPSPSAPAELPITDAAASALIAGMFATLQSMGVLTSANASSITSTSISTTTMTETLNSTTQTQMQATPVTTTVTPVVTSTTIVYPSVTPTDTNGSYRVEEVKASEPVPFIGLFFSTFFGGHGQEYATPKDQYVWFKNFSMTINS